MPIFATSDKPPNVIFLVLRKLLFRKGLKFWNVTERAEPCLVGGCKAFLTKTSMTTRGTKVLLSLLAVATLGFSMVNAYTFFVENRNPFGALNLTKLIIKASPEEQTGMELSNFKLQINTSGGQLNVHKICDENGENCRDVDVLYTWTQGNQWPQWNTWAHVVTWYVSWNDIVFGLSDDSTITLANVIAQISSTWPQWDTWAQWATWASIVAWEVSGNNIIFTLSDDTTITIQNIIQTITWPQGNTWTSWTWIHHINTWYENWITTVEIYTDEHTIATTFQIRDWADWGTPTDIESIIRDILGQIRWDYRKPNALDQSGYVIGPTSNQTGLVWKTDGEGNPGWRPDETSSIKITAGDPREICVQWDGTINCDTVTLWKPEDFVNNKYCIFDNNNQIVCNANWTEWESLNIVWSPDQRCKYQCVRKPSLSLTWKCDWDDSNECNAAHTEYSNNLNCTDQTDDTNCIRYYLRIKDNVTRFTDVDYDDWDCSIICDQAEPTCQGQCEWWPTDIEWNPFGRCRYMCSSYKVDGLNDGNWQNNSFSNMQALLQHISESLNNDDFWKPENIERTWCKIKCNAPEPSWWWDSLWTEIASTNTITPKGKGVNVYINWTFNVEPDNDTTIYKNLPDFKVTQSGIAAFWWLTYWIEGTDWLIRRWLSVHWPIIAWNNSNHISMYADWDFGDDERRFEIMWNNELAIWTEFGAFIYFTQLTGEFRTDLVYAATSKEPVTPKEPWWWKGASQPYDYYDINTINLDNPVHAYQSLMVGVNTNNPFATLDVNGSLKIWHNCVPNGSKCTEDKEWTMMYFVNTSDIWVLAVCTKTTGGGHKRVNLLKTSEQDVSITNLWYPNDNYCYIPKPHPWDPFGGVAVQEIDSLIDNQY